MAETPTPPPRLAERAGAVLDGLRASRLTPSPTELLALALLVGGACAVLALLWWRAAPEGGGVLHAVAFEEPAPLVVHVAGHVARPGLVELRAQARVADALRAAGGPLPGAELDALNLARAVADGERLVVPAPGETGPGPASAWSQEGTVDLNLATGADLERLPGIGPVLAERIVAHREAHGPFPNVEALRGVRGIGPKLFAQLAELVRV